MRRRGDLATADHKRMRLAHDFALARAHRAPGLEKEEDVGTSLAPPATRPPYPELVEGSDLARRNHVAFGATGS